jgi:hypothetical protein
MAKTVKMEPEVENQEMTMEEAQAKIKEMQESGELNKPTEEETLAAAEELDVANKEFQEKLYKIGTAEVADEIFDFMINFIENNIFWTKQGWMGVLRMYEELIKAKKDKKEGEEFAVGYQALEFMFYALTNPGGIGLKSAKEIEGVADFYADLIEMTGEVVKEAREDGKKLQFLADKVTAMQQGFYLEQEPAPEKEGTFAAPSAEDLLKKN